MTIEQDRLAMMCTWFVSSCPSLLMVAAERLQGVSDLLHAAGSEGWIWVYTAGQHTS